MHAVAKHDRIGGVGIPILWYPNHTSTFLSFTKNSENDVAYAH